MYQNLIGRYLDVFSNEPWRRIWCISKGTRDFEVASFDGKKSRYLSIFGRAKKKSADWTTTIFHHNKGGVISKCGLSWQQEDMFSIENHILTLPRKSSHGPNFPRSFNKNNQGFHWFPRISTFPRWWLNQPNWKIFVKIGIFPKIGMKIWKKKWNHHLVSFCRVLASENRCPSSSIQATQFPNLRCHAEKSRQLEAMPEMPNLIPCNFRTKSPE